MKKYYVGLMSGTSVDGIDAALVSLDDNSFTVERALCTPWPSAVRRAVESLCTTGRDELHRVAQLDVELAWHFAEVALAVIAPLAPSCITAIGSHGQTVRHAPGVRATTSDASAVADATTAQPRIAYSVQLGAGAVIAERTGITTVNDFRARDLAAGGEGAPLAPAFHRAVFSDAKEARVIVNIGGIANLSCLPAAASDATVPSGLDSGPGNTLLDLWMQQHCGQPFDKDGAWAGSGRINEALLADMRADPYFARSAPKSTGREYFNAEWLQPFIAHHRCAPVDVQATLVALSCDTIADAIARITCAWKVRPVLYLCGGGAHNPLFARRFCDVHGYVVHTTATLGIVADWVEAAAFGWLAARTLDGQVGNVPTVTGAHHAAILGAIHRA